MILWAPFGKTPVSWGSIELKTGRFSRLCRESWRYYDVPVEAEAFFGHVIDGATLWTDIDSSQWPPARQDGKALIRPYGRVVADACFGPRRSLELTV